MSIVSINLGQAANDGTGEALRSGGEKINANFAELDTRVNAAKNAADTANTALPGKQPLNAKLTSLATAIGTAAGLVPYLRNASATAYSFAELVLDLYDPTPARIMTTGYGGIGLNNNAAFLGTNLNPDNYVVSAHSYWGTWTLAGIGNITGFLSLQTGESNNRTQKVSAVDGNSYQRAMRANVWGAWYRSLLSGDNGLQIALLNRTMTPDASIATGQANTGASFAYSNTAPVSGNDAATMTLQVSAGYAGQFIHDLSTNEIYIRSKIGGTVGAYSKQYNSRNVVADPTVVNGGIVSTVIISGWTVTRFRNGSMIMILPFQQAGSALAANEQRVIDWAVPTAFDLSKPWHATASVVPQTDYNYTVPSCWCPSSGSIFRVAVRNGPTAQTFNVSLRLEAFWG
ncbi:baseplate wedge subunit and tail pin protein [Pseudomonas phage PMBT14]|uniref:Baseplate wedge subunit and tail pin protein n=1 Tax=Pseudomonas phage PMBT14 TaxID=2059855 RepID=A0A2I6PI67_9CAUD|nr:baseplate wedge tail fiber protein connector [Pseudomonas phage PMBT14]AUM59734.1 baseplate wedge subunit and tail pin protein [Pseudomonas phage PMBT14]